MAAWRNFAKDQQQNFDFDRFLDEVAAAGLQAIEGGGSEDVLGTPDELREKLSARGLRLCSYGTNVTVEPWEPNTLRYEADMDDAVAYGTNLLMVCGGFLATPRRNTYPADYDLFAENLSLAIDAADSRGLTFAFHPHRGCIVETIAETQMMVDRLPHLKICCDTAHLTASGEDPVKFIETFGDRIVHTHIKDYDSRTRKFTDPGRGDGCMDVRACLDALRAANYTGPLCLEKDGNPDLPPAEVAKIGADYLKAFLG